MNQQLDFFDTTARKHRGNPESRAAHTDVRETAAATRAKILAQIDAAGPAGLTCDEAAVINDTTPNAISGRFTELKGIPSRNLPQLIAKAGTRPTRSGSRAAVYVTQKHFRK